MTDMRFFARTPSHQVSGFIVGIVGPAISANCDF